MESIGFENAVLIDSSKVNNFFNKHIIKNLGLAKNIATFNSCLSAINFIENKGDDNLIFVDLHAPCRVDLNSPCMNGWEFLEKLRKLSINTKTKVVVMHSKTLLPEEEIKLYQYPFVKLITNSYLEEQLITKIFD